MSQSKRLSRDQKRKQKLQFRNSRRPAVQQPTSLTEKYRSEKFVQPLFTTELGIYQSYVIEERELTDADVEISLIELISRLRTTPAAELMYDKDGAVGGTTGAMICIGWKDLLEAGTLPAREDLIGILRSILESLATWRTRSRSSRGYLNFLEGFLTGKMGVKVQRVTEDGEPYGDDAVDELYEIGQMWLAGSVSAREEFKALVAEYLQSGQRERVINVGQRLIGELTDADRPEFKILTRIVLHASDR